MKNPKVKKGCIAIAATAVIGAIASGIGYGQYKKKNQQSKKPK